MLLKYLTLVCKTSCHLLHPRLWEFFFSFRFSKPNHTPFKRLMYLSANSLKLDSDTQMSSEYSYLFITWNKLVILNSYVVQNT